MSFPCLFSPSFPVISSPPSISQRHKTPPQKHFQTSLLVWLLCSDLRIWWVKCCHKQKCFSDFSSGAYSVFNSSLWLYWALEVNMYKTFVHQWLTIFPHCNSYSLPRRSLVSSAPVPVLEPSVCEPELGVWWCRWLWGPLWRTAQFVLWETFCLLWMAKSCEK